MLCIILRCFQFFEHLATYAWKLLVKLGFLAVLVLTKLFGVILSIVKGVTILGQEFQLFVSVIKQSVDDTILTIRLIGDTISEYIIGCLKYILNTLETSVPSKEKVEGTSINLVEFLLRSLNLIADAVWWLVTLLPRTVIKVFVALGDFCVFGLDTARQCLCYFIQGLIDDTMRTTVGVTVIFTFFVYWREIFNFTLDAMLFLRLIVADQIHFMLIRLRYRLPTSNYIRRSGRLRRSVLNSGEETRSVSVTDDKLTDQQRCVICKTKGKCVLLWPCRHLCLCDECADLLSEQNVNLCPLCRADIELTISVYM